MEVTKREVLFSVIIVLVMLMLGLLIGNKISEGIAQEAERYMTATVIEDEQQFRYGMDTNFGNALVYGEIATNSPVTYDEIGNGYIYIEKVKEHYTRHTRTVTKQTQMEKHIPKRRFTIPGIVYGVIAVKPILSTSVAPIFQAIQYRSLFIGLV